MTAAVSTKHTTSFWQSHCNKECTARWRKAIVAIAKIATCLFFPWMAIIAACSFVPAAVAIWVVPLVALTSVTAGVVGLKHLFPEAECLKPKVPPEEVEQEEELAKPLSPGAPRGIRRGSMVMNCWANALFQMCMVNPQVKRWFLSEEGAKKLNGFHRFTNEYDKVVEAGRRVVREDSQMLRKDVAGSISRRSGQQEDPSEALMAIQAALPNDLKPSSRLVRTYTLTAGQPPMQGGHVRPDPVEERSAYFSLAINGPAPRLKQLIHAAFNSRLSFELKMGGITYNGNQAKRCFVEAPSFFWFHLLRFKNEAGVTTKITTDVAIPETYTIESLGDCKTTCELNSFIVHQSNCVSAGHYVAYCKDVTTGQWYEINDHRVRAIDGKEMREKSQQAYLVQYVALPN